MTWCSLAEWVMRGKGQAMVRARFGAALGPECLSSAAAGRPCDRLGTLAQGEMVRGEDAGERPPSRDRTGAMLCGGRSVGQDGVGQLRTFIGAVRLGVESLAAVPGRD